MRLPILQSVVLLSACQGTAPDPASHLATTTSPQARQHFDRGLLLAWGFNHDEAIRSFQAAAQADPMCAMAYWGIALANGPHINNPAMEPARSAAAWQAWQKARALAGSQAPVDQALIKALGARYAEQPPEDRRPLDEAYAAAMRAVWQAHPHDDDVGVLFAEAMMDLRPWKLWTPDGRPEPGTEEILATLETVLARRPDHPGACHLYIHAVEASLHPEKALAAADRLRDLVPDSGHLVHMPSHIYVRTGRYADASLANEKAIAADLAYHEKAGTQGFYEIYRLHNYHFLAYASMLEGRFERGMWAARQMRAQLPDELLQAMPEALDGYLPVALEVMVRFGRWEDVLREPEPMAKLVVTRSIHHFARALAHAALGRMDEALKEHAAFTAQAAAVTDKHVIGNNTAKAVLEVAARMLEGELRFRQGKTDEAFAALREAIQREDALAYDEPPGWMHPVRHALGALLLQAGRVAEAEQIYREDLLRLPENGWSLLGLSQCLGRRGEKAETHVLRARFEKAWGRADVTLRSSCFCAGG